MTGLIWLCIAAVLGLAAAARSAIIHSPQIKAGNERLEQKAKDAKSEIKQTHDIEVPDFYDLPISYEWDLVGEYQYAADMMKQLFEEYKKDHPIGSIVIRYDGPLNDQRTRHLIEDEHDQYQAFIRAPAYINFVTTGNHAIIRTASPYGACCWAARIDAAKRGYAPSNTEYYMWDGYEFWKTRPEYKQYYDDPDKEELMSWYSVDPMPGNYVCQSKNFFPDEYDVEDRYKDEWCAQKYITNRLEALKRTQEHHNRTCAADPNCIAAVEAYKAALTIPKRKRSQYNHLREKANIKKFLEWSVVIFFISSIIFCIIAGSK